MSNEFHHVSVLLEECIEGLNIKPEGTYMDGTLGGAGHSSRIAALLTSRKTAKFTLKPTMLPCLSFLWRSLPPAAWRSRT